MGKVFNFPSLVEKRGNTLEMIRSLWNEEAIFDQLQLLATKLIELTIGPVSLWCSERQHIVGYTARTLSAPPLSDFCRNLYWLLLCGLPSVGSSLCLNLHTLLLSSLLEALLRGGFCSIEPLILNGQAKRRQTVRMLGFCYACSRAFELFAHAWIPRVTEASFGRNNVRVERL